MRMELDLDVGLLRQAEKLAIETGTTLTELVSDALRERLARRQGIRSTAAAIPTFRGRGVHPGIELSNNAELLDYVERQEDPH